MDELFKAGIDGIRAKLFDALWLLGVALVVAIVTAIAAAWRGQQTRWAYMAAGAALTLFITLVALVALALIADRLIALAASASIMVLIPCAIWIINKVASKPVRAFSSKADVLAYYFMQVVKRRDLLKDANVDPAKARLWADEVAHFRTELRQSSKVLSPETAGEFAAEPDYSGMSDRDRGLVNADHMLPVLLRKWSAWGGHTAPPPSGL